MTDFRSTDEDTRPASAWATGGVVFAATMLIMIGIFQALQGLAAIIKDDFYVSLPNYAFDVDLTAWGWIHLIVGIVVALTGFYLFSGSAVAGGVAIAMASVSAITNFFFVPYYPFWSLLIIAICIFAIWSVARSGMLSNR